MLFTVSLELAALDLHQCQRILTIWLVVVERQSAGLQEIACLSAWLWCEIVFGRKHAAVIVVCALCFCANAHGHIQLADFCLLSPHKSWAIHIHNMLSVPVFGMCGLARWRQIIIH